MNGEEPSLSLLFDVDDSQCLRTSMGAQDAAYLTDGDFVVWKLFVQAGCYALGFFLCLGVHHSHVFDRLLRAEELDHSGDRPRPRPNTVDGFDRGVLRHEQERLEVEDRPG